MAEREIGRISHYYNYLEVGIIDLTGPLKVGDTIRIKGTVDDFIQTVQSLHLEHKNTQQAIEGDSVGTKVAQRAREGDRVYLVAE